MAAAAPPSDNVSHVSDAFSGHEYDQDGDVTVKLSDVTFEEASNVSFSDLSVAFSELSSQSGLSGAVSSLTYSSASTFSDDEDENDENRTEGGAHTNSMRDRDKKIGHRRVDKAGIVSYKKKPTSELMAAIQLGIGQSVGGLSSKPERDVLMQDFGVVEVVFFPGEGSNLTPAHHYSDFRFKTYAPVAFRYFRDLFGIQPDDFMLSLCDEPLKELSNPGASGSIFYLTHDDEFIIKTVQHKEADFLQKLLPGYFLNISQNKRTLLPKFYGLYCYQNQVWLKGTVKKQSKQDEKDCGGKNIRFTVMNNLLPSTVKLHEKYDMKGSTYKRKASKHERSKNSPTLKDLDFMENHPEGLQLEKDTYDALIKTLQRDCRVLESFKIMDYSLLVGIYNLDLANKEKMGQQTGCSETGPSDSSGNLGTTGNSSATSGPVDTGTNTSNTVLQRGKSFRTRIGQYSTPMESIQGNTDLNEEMEEDEDVPPGGIPARNAKGERLLIYLGIIDILQSFRLKKRLEHTVKSMVIDGDTISVHRPSYYAQRFLQYHATRVFRKAPTALKHSPSKKKSLVNKSRGQPSIPEEGGGGPHRPERGGRTISFSDEVPPMAGTGAVGGKPDLLPEYSRMPSGNSNRSPSPRSPAYNVNGNSRQQKRKWMRSEAFNLNTYPSEDALSAGTASTASLRGPVYTTSGHRGPSPPLSLSESTPTHTDFTEGTPSFTNSSPSCSSDAMGTAVHNSCVPALSTTTTTTYTTTTSVSTTSVYTTTRGDAGTSSELGSSKRSQPSVTSARATTWQGTPRQCTTVPMPVLTSSSSIPASCLSTTAGTTIPPATSTTKSTATIDMGSSNPLDTAGLDSPARSPARSPDLRSHSNKGGRGASSSFAQSSQAGHVSSSNVVVSEQKAQAKVKLTPETSPPIATFTKVEPETAVAAHVKTSAIDNSQQGSSATQAVADSESTPVSSISSSTMTGPTVEEVSADKSEMDYLQIPSK